MIETYKGHTYQVERDCQVSIATLFFCGTGKIYTDILDGAYYQYELFDALDDLIAQGENDRDRENEDNNAFH